MASPLAVSPKGNPQPSPVDALLDRRRLSPARIQEIRGQVVGTFRSFIRPARLGASIDVRQLKEEEFLAETKRVQGVEERRALGVCGGDFILINLEKCLPSEVPGVLVHEYLHALAPEGSGDEAATEFLADHVRRRFGYPNVDTCYANTVLSMRSLKPVDRAALERAHVRIGRQPTLVEAVARFHFQNDRGALAQYLVGFSGRSPAVDLSVSLWNRQLRRDCGI